MGIVGTGAVGSRRSPLAASAQHLYVFQRTPSAIGVRGNRPTDRRVRRRLEPGWQRARMENFSAVMIGVPVERDLIDDGWTHHMRGVTNPQIDAGDALDAIEEMLESADFAVMEEHRARVAEIVADPTVAESLKPYYRYMCKRPCFHDEYLDTYNRPEVTLVDSPSGIERVTERGVVVGGQEIELDCIVYATGFEAELTPFPRRATHPIVGRDGVTIAEKFADGPSTLFGLMTSGFPNLFLMPSPGMQSVVTVNYTHLVVEGAEHVAGTIAALDEQGIDVVDVTPEAEAAWTDGIVEHLPGHERVHVGVHAVAHQLRGGHEPHEPARRRLRRGPRRLLRVPAGAADWRAANDFTGLRVERRTTDAP